MSVGINNYMNFKKNCNMKLQIIETPEYYLAVSDEKIEDGKTFVTKDGVVHTLYGYNYGDKVVVTYKLKDNSNDIIQTLKQPKTPKWFIAEMELCNNCINHQGQHLSSDCCHNYKLKTTTNSEGKHVFVGHYEY